MNKFIFNPFVRIAGIQSLFIGIAIILVTAFVASVGNIHLDGVIDLHVAGTELPGGSEVTFTLALAEGLVNLLSLVLVVYVSGLLLSRSSIRFIDVIGTQSMARFPYLIASFTSLLVSDEKMLNYVQHQVMKQGEAVNLTTWDYVSFAFSAIIFLAMFVWMLVLMYKAYSVSCNLKGTKAIVSFIVCLLIAETVSKIVLNFLIY